MGSQADLGLEASLRGPQSPVSIQPVGHQDCWGSCLKHRALRVNVKVWGASMAPTLYPLCLGFLIAVLCRAREFPGHTTTPSPSTLVWLVYTKILPCSSKPRVLHSLLPGSPDWPEATSVQNSSLGKGFSPHGLSSGCQPMHGDVVT